MLANLAPDARIGIVGGGLFPRSCLALQRLFPQSRIVVIDAADEHLRVARDRVPNTVQFVHARFDPNRPEELPGEFDLLVVPLAFVGDREAIYRRPAAPRVLVHEWIWRPRGATARISWVLLKRLNLVTQ